MVKYYILLLIVLISNIYKINPYLVFPIEYLKDSNYKFIDNQNVNEPEIIMKRIFFKNLMTKIEIGTPLILINFIYQVLILQ